MGISTLMPKDFVAYSNALQNLILNSGKYCANHFLLIIRKTPNKWTHG